MLGWDTCPNSESSWQLAFLTAIMVQKCIGRCAGCDIRSVDPLCSDECVSFDAADGRLCRLWYSIGGSPMFWWVCKLWCRWWALVQVVIFDRWIPYFWWVCKLWCRWFYSPRVWSTPCSSWSEYSAKTRSLLSQGTTRSNINVNSRPNAHCPP